MKNEAMQMVDFPALIFPTLTAGSVFTVQDIDTLGYRAATIRVFRKPNISDTAAASATLRLLHSDTTGTNTSMVTLTPSITIPRSTTTQYTGVRIEVDLKGCKRYLRLEYTGSTGTVSGGDVVLGIASLFRPETGPTAQTALLGTAFLAPQVLILSGGANTNTVG